MVAVTTTSAVAAPATRRTVAYKGLTSDQAAVQLGLDGPNSLADAPKRRIIFAIFRRIANPLVALLLIAAACAGIGGDPASFAIIVAVVLLSIAMDVVQEHRAEATVAALRQSIALKALVIRDGNPLEIPVEQIVRGDLVRLTAGDLIPADGTVMLANAAQVNEALLTGEAFPVEKRAASGDAGRMFKGTSLIGGSAEIRVTATGQATRFGAIAMSLLGEDHPTAFERGVRRLGMLIIRLTMFLVLFVLLARLVLGRPALESFLFAVALAVGLTPELLPMVMTVSLARGAQRMAKAKVVVKKLSAIHDLGEMDVLCTDKTGTLTEAQISLVGFPGIDGEDDPHVAELAAINAQFETGLKSPLDDALLRHEVGLASWRKLGERPFDFERRRVSVLAEREGRRLEIVKGAPETILALCDRAQTRDGRIVPLDPELKTSVMALHEQHCLDGHRLLGVAWKEAKNATVIEDVLDEGLIFSGWCVFEDPPKLSAAAAIVRLHAAGVTIKVISGDAAPVVRHLVGTLSLPMEGLLTGPDIEKLSDEALAARVDRVDLFARVTPAQKTRIVNALAGRGHVVGFLGDGINDAPAIRAADVGLSVDGATDVAREAADMILLAPDLGVVADGVAEGRRTYANIMKYLRMGTSSNFGNMLSMAIASLVIPFLPLTAVQVLLNNLLYDSSQIGIPFDAVDADEVARPSGWDMRALLRFAAVMGPLSSLFDLATFAILLAWVHPGIAGFRSAWFIESMATQILVVFVIRTTKPFWQSSPHRMLMATAIGGLAVALALPFTPFAATLGFAFPGLNTMGAILVLILGYLASAEIMKRFALRSLASVCRETAKPVSTAP